MPSKIKCSGWVVYVEDDGYNTAPYYYNWPTPAVYLSGTTVTVRAVFVNKREAQHVSGYLRRFRGWKCRAVPVNLIPAGPQKKLDTT